MENFYATAGNKSNEMGKSTTRMENRMSNGRKYDSDWFVAHKKRLISIEWGEAGSFYVARIESYNKRKKMFIIRWEDKKTSSVSLADAKFELLPIEDNLRIKDHGKVCTAKTGKKKICKWIQKFQEKEEKAKIISK